MSEATFCPHGDYPDDCETCLGLCPHGYALLDCSECSWGMSGGALDAYWFHGASDEADARSADAFARASSGGIEVDGYVDFPSGAGEASRVYHQHQVERKQKVYDSIRRVLKAHGVPLHWSVIATMVRSEVGQVDDRTVYNTLVAYQETFEGLGEGVYDLNSGR